MKRRALALARALGSVTSRAAGALLVVWVLATLVFVALRVLPGDPAALVLGDQAGEAERAALRAKLGLDRPLALQYVAFARAIATLDLGDSLRRPGTAAFALVGRALGPTAALASLAVSLGAVLGVALALLSLGPWLGERRHLAHRVMLVLAATPLLAFAPLATWALAVRARIVPLPGDPDAGASGLAFAATLLALPLGAQVARIGRAALADLGRAPFLEVAAAKGASPSRVWLVHALPVVAAPLSAVVATQLGALLGGAVVLERLFERPGLGTTMLDAYAARDLPVLEGAVVAAGLLFVGVQVVADVIATAVDPRGREP